MLGPTIRRGAGLRAAGAPSGSSSPSPGRAGQLRRQGRIQNHRSESNIAVRNGFHDDHPAESIARVKEHEDRILVKQEVYPVLETPVPDCSPRN